ncbi:helix-turn-helix domain-containing protein [Streptomyces sp. NPDC059193]|uniref:helix-turn-helix domain-containing protein n=1 Tax=Streptomyces sp. NPDC059193 TaxID=3346763 RepID=UPI0036999E42
MPRQSVPFDRAALRRAREAVGLSQARLALRSGIKASLVKAYELGHRGPSPRNLVLLAAALGVQPQVLAGIPEGEESLRHLRQLGGRDRWEIAAALCGKVPGSSVQAVDLRLAAVERGQEVPEWKDSVTLRRLVGLLAQLYGAPPAKVRLAWFRAFPSQAALLRAAPRKPDGATVVPDGTGAGKTWAALNDRQRAYLVACYRADQEAASEAASTRGAGQDPGPAATWRKLVFTVRADPAFTGYTPIQETLRLQGHHDAGAGATLHALARRGLLTVMEDQVEVFPLGFVPRIRVELTRAGRACARAGTGEHTPLRRPAHLLSEWLWRSLVKVASAPDGLPETALWGKARFYLGTGYRPRGVLSRGYIDEVPVLEGVGEDSYVKEYRWRLTEEGRRHISDHHPVYRALYPDVATEGMNLVIPYPN